MAIFQVINPYPVFIGSDGKPLDNGRVYIGEPGFEARSRPKAAFYDSDLTIPAATGSGGYIQTMAGYPFWNGAARAIYVDGNYSITVTDRYDAIVFTAMTQFFGETAGVVADFSDLTALAAATDLTAGERVTVQRGWQDQPETFQMQAAGLYANNGATVVNVPPSGLQAVSFRREFATEAELVADTRPGTWFATDPASDVEGTVFRAAGSRGYRMALSVATDHDLTTVGGVRLYSDAPSHGLLATESARLIADLDATGRVAGLHRTDAATTGTFPTGIVAADRLGVIVGNGVAGEGFEFAPAIAQLRSFIRRKVAGAFGAFREVVEVSQGAATGDLAYFNGTEWARLAGGDVGTALLGGGTGVAPSFQAVQSVVILDDANSPATDGFVTTLAPSNWRYAELILSFISMSGTDNLELNPFITGFGNVNVASTSKVFGSTSFTTTTGATRVVIAVGNASLTVSGTLRMWKVGTGGTTALFGEYKFRRSDDVLIEGNFVMSPPTGGTMNMVIATSGTNTFDGGNYRWAYA